MTVKNIVEEIFVKNMRHFLLMIALCGVVTPLFAYPSRLIDMPTAGTLKRAEYTFDSRIMPPGGGASGAGVLLGMDFGITDRFQLGVSYGGDGLVGRGHVDWYPWPGAHLKFRIFDENRGPAFAVGIDMQGYGGNAGVYRGFIYKSPGFYGTLSKGFGGGRVGTDWHLMVNYSLEDLERVNWPNAVFAIDFRFNSELLAIVEYDFAFNQLDIDEEPDTYGGPHKGFLNFGIEWNFLGGFGIQFNVRDVFQQRLGGYVKDGDDNPHGWGRELIFQYKSRF